MRIKLSATGEVYLKDLHPNIGKYLFYKALLSGQVFLIPVLLPIYQKCGLHNWDILRLQAFFAVALAIFSIAGAHFADRVNKKRSLLIGIVVTAAGLVQYGLAHDFNGLLIAELILAVGIAFQLGAEHALLYDSLLELKREDLHREIRRIALIGGTVVGAICGAASKAVAAHCGEHTAPLVGSLVILGAFPIVWLMKEPKPREEEKRTVQLSDLRNASKEAFRKGGTLRWLMVFAGILTALTWAGFPLLQPLYA